MDLNFTLAEEAFRTDVRVFMTASLSPETAAKVREGRTLTKADMEAYHAALNARGWLAPSWPAEYGGADWTPVQKHIFDEEAARASAPRLVPFGIAMLAPVLLKFGTQDQRDHYMPRILNGTDWWCQGYSEPGAGSDLAGLKTRAVRDGDDYIVNGQKTWTTLGQHADWIFCLVRTKPDAKPQEGISFLLIDMTTPGVEVRPIRLLEGGHEVNEVFLTDVRVPMSNLVGEENQGWTIAKYLLTHERNNIAGVGFSIAAFESLLAFARKPHRSGRRLIDDTLFAARLARIEVDLEAMKITNLRLVVANQKESQKAGQGSLQGPAAPGVESSILKIKGVEVRQALNDLSRRALGPAAAPFPSEDLAGNAAIVPASQAANAAAYFNNRKMSIYGGSNEIQKNILAKALLGL